MTSLIKILHSLQRRAENRISSLKRYVPIRFHGCLFIPLQGDHVFDAMRNGFESNEIAFIERYLSQGDTFWDIGANFGLYTLLGASRICDPLRILSIEPDPRNYLRLRLNLLLNKLWNVKTMQIAMSDHVESSVNFIMCSQGAYSALKVADVPGSLKSIHVRQTTIDSLADQLGWPEVNLLKMDVEGAELLVLNGGINFFSQHPRPLVMCEFSDRRTISFGYPASQIYQWLAERDYVWFEIKDGGRLSPVSAQGVYNYDNLVACPREKLGMLPVLVS